MDMDMDMDVDMDVAGYEPVSDETENCNKNDSSESVESFYSRARREFRAAGWTNDLHEFNDDAQLKICNDVLELLRVFHEAGHSGSSAHYALDLFTKLAKFEPIVPLIGDDSEWNLVAAGGSTNGVDVYQNNRCSRVFKQSDRYDGQAHDIGGKVFWEWYTDAGKECKAYFTSSDSCTLITFPYTPTTVYEEYQRSPTMEGHRLADD